MLVCFFFQAEDGIRDYKVTGVQTCALPISIAWPNASAAAANFEAARSRSPSRNARSPGIERVVIAPRLGDGASPFCHVCRKTAQVAESVSAARSSGDAVTDARAIGRSPSV